MTGTSITFIGAGNLAWHLAPALDNTDYAVREVYSRNKKHADELVSKLYEAQAKESLDFSTSSSRFFIIAVPDDAIEELVAQLFLPNQAILVHTSGSKPMNVLSDATTPNIGVLYPLQTFSKGRKVNLKEVPFFVEGENKETEKALVNLASTLSKNVQVLPSPRRAMLHLAAVFSSNFTNHMLSIAESIMQQNKLEYDWLKPLLAETINKSLDIGPTRAQTGPARRGDLEILDNHVESLKGDESLQEIYRVISQHILDKYQS
ncbi:MAG TPA: Rossmann-like and DUF2520 domain-containing protein [Cyclobacteriaceae bacterium]|nr:Rossmann-like and DUF2520 domain-containing protein [Cyclobacteriaceae bacterium]